MPVKIPPAHRSAIAPIGRAAKRQNTLAVVEDRRERGIVRSRDEDHGDRKPRSQVRGDGRPQIDLGDQIGVDTENGLGAGEPRGSPTQSPRCPQKLFLFEISDLPPMLPKQHVQRGPTYQAAHYNRRTLTRQCSVCASFLSELSRRKLDRAIHSECRRCRHLVRIT